MKIFIALLIAVLCVSCAERAKPRQITNDEAIELARQAAISKGHQIPESWQYKNANLEEIDGKAIWTVGFDLAPHGGGTHLNVWVDARSKEILKFEGKKHLR
jgi:hypothetical protein